MQAKYTLFTLAQCVSEKILPRRVISQVPANTEREETMFRTPGSRRPACYLTPCGDARVPGSIRAHACRFRRPRRKLAPAHPKPHGSGLLPSDEENVPLNAREFLGKCKNMHTDPRFAQSPMFDLRQLPRRFRFHHSRQSLHAGDGRIFSRTRRVPLGWGR